MEGHREPLRDLDPQVPLQLSHIVKDIQRTQATVLNTQNTVYEAVVWMRQALAGTVPVSAAGAGPRSLTALQTITAETILQALLDGIPDPAGTLGTFFATPLDALSCRRVPIVCPRMDLRNLIDRMIRCRTDLLLVFDGIKYTGLVAAGDIFDAMIGTAVIDHAFFNVDMTDPGTVMENIRVCCLKQSVAGIADRHNLRHLNPVNTLLTAARILCAPSSSTLLISDPLRQRHCHICARDILLMLAHHFECSLSDQPLAAELLRPLETVCDLTAPVLTPNDTVFEAVRTIHFNNLTGAVILAEGNRLEGIVTTDTLLKAFLDSINRTSEMVPN